MAKTILIKAIPISKFSYEYIDAWVEDNSSTILWVCMAIVQYYKHLIGG